MAKLFWRYGTMSAGKSVALLSVAHNYTENGQAVSIYTSHLDDRYGKGRVASRIDISADANVIDYRSDSVIQLNHRNKEPKS